MAKIALRFGRHAGTAAIIGGLLLTAAPARAASLSSRDVQIIAKALGFLDPARPGGAVAVIYAAGNAASQADAEAIAGLFGEGLRSGTGIVTARAIDAASLGNGAGYIAMILAAGAEDSGTAVPAPHGMLSVTAAYALVRDGRCIMAVHSQPRVDITVNRAAAQAQGVDFTAAFGMLVHEI